MRKPDEGDKAGLYITVIFHLGLLIILLVCQIGSAIRKGDTFVIDFSKQEAKEQVQKEMNLKEEVAEKINQMLEYVSSLFSRTAYPNSTSSLLNL